MSHSKDIVRDDDVDFDADVELEAIAADSDEQESIQEEEILSAPIQRTLDLTQ